MAGPRNSGRSTAFTGGRPVAVFQVAPETTVTLPYPAAELSRHFDGLGARPWDLRRFPFEA
ncbi:hypothetical protein I545_0830 [Mycobacterium kansasii 662]|uniref:Uncharacterized protein n=2 Tax=Mycobacterium kansasii TaxID=1768 RepID=A0A1V3XSS4_MYCKA|nr:hypothetical protein I545_0830 [Mycobacterium kansasii 662]OOK82152.1 hypothetical protein BZL30_0911 [Mycobacterium kansasii]